MQIFTRKTEMTCEKVNIDAERLVMADLFDLLRESFELGVERVVKQNIYELILRM